MKIVLENTIRLHHFSWIEGFGRAIIEADAMEVLVIVMNLSGHIDAMKEGLAIFIVKKVDSQSLYQSMNDIYKMHKVGLL